MTYIYFVDNIYNNITDNILDIAIHYEKEIEMDSKLYQDYLHILKKELVPALGCTEPIALAYAAAKCRETLGVFPEKVEALCSGNIIKNVK